MVNFTERVREILNRKKLPQSFIYLCIAIQRGLGDETKLTLNQSPCFVYGPGEQNTKIFLGFYALFMINTLRSRPQKRSMLEIYSKSPSTTFNYDVIANIDDGYFLGYTLYIMASPAQSLSVCNMVRCDCFGI